MDPHEPAKPVMLPDDRPQSPFQRLVFEPNTQVDASAWSVDRLIETTITGDAAEAAGALLACAIWHGALLDPDRWPGWLTNLPGLHDGIFSWFDLPAVGSAGPTRWFVDPMSRLLLDRWVERSATPADLLSPWLCLNAFLKLEGATPEVFIEQAEWRWRLRLPAMLVEKAFGRTQDRSLPDAAWARLLHPAPVSAPQRQKTKRATIKAATPSPIEKLLSGQALAKRAEAYRHRSKKQIRNDLEKTVKLVPSLNPRADLLDAFMVNALWKNVRTKQGRPYEPATIGKYASTLRRRVFDAEWLGSLDPTNRDELEQRYLSAVRSANGDARDKILNAIEAFDRFCQHCCSELSLADRGQLARLREEGSSGGIVNLLTGAEYERALAALSPVRTFEVDQARLSLILGYRAGLRLRELRALAVNDVLFREGDYRCDLLIRNKRHAYTKTGTSRRVLPLHVLLTPDELAELRVWHSDRDQKIDHQVAPRLFPARDRPTRAMPSKFLKGHLLPVLKNVTGDANVSYNWLRHSFISHLLATLFLPDDGTSLPLPQGWKRNDVSLQRKREVMGALIGAERLGQGALHAVSHLAGHLPTDTTISSYTHSLDWILSAHVCRPANQQGLTITQAERLTRMSNAALRKHVQRLPNVETKDSDDDSSYRVPVLKRARRGRGRAQASEPTSVYPDQLLASAARRQRRVGHQLPSPRAMAAPTAPSQAEVIAWRPMLACVRHAVATEDRAEAAARFDVPRNILDRWLAARDTLLSPPTSDVPFEERSDRSRRGPPHMASRTIRDRTRQDAITNRWRDNFPRVPSDREADLIDPLWERAMRAPDDQVAPGIWVFAHRYEAHRNVIIARGWEEAGDVQRLLDILGVKAPVVHHPGRGCSRAEIATIRTPRPPRGISRKDRFSFVLANWGAAEPRTRSSGLRQALVLLSLFHLDTRGRSAQSSLEEYVFRQRWFGGAG